MDPRLKDLYDHISVHATADREHEAVIELLVLMMMSDHHITTDEIDAIRDIATESGWESDTFSFDRYVGPATAKVRAAVEADGVDALLEDIDDRIASNVLRQSLYGAAREVAQVDHDLDPEEHSLLGQIAVRFA
jgi:uncharacterized tellurite resistance protein B-like protein